MKSYEDNRPTEEIADDVERTRAHLSSTIDAIQSKLTPGQMMDQAFNYARTSLPADFGANLGNAVRDNPVPIALIGVGIAWLMMSGQADGRARLRRQSADYERDYATGYGAEPLLDEAAESEGRMHQAASKASETGHRLADKASELGHRISDKTAAITGRARGASERMRGSAGNARARVGELSQRSQERYYRAKDSFSHMAEEQPLMLGVLGMAFGAALGAAFPSTRREDELMGRTRDDLLESAKETGREQAETLKESARRVAETAKQETERTAGAVSSGAPAQGNGQVEPPGVSAGTESGRQEPGRPPSLH